MATMSSGPKSQEHLLENITLLWTLCKIPGKPNENRIRQVHDEGRQLSWDREKQLADIFAFISAWTDDIARVMAVCVEEDPENTGMIISLASNSGDLSHVTQGFNDIARILEQASFRKTSRIDIRQDLFRQIVILDEPRILSRLRSSHATESQKTKDKPPLLPLLNTTVHHESIIGRNATSRALITSIRSNSIRLSDKISDFETARRFNNSSSVSQDMLIDLLKEIEVFNVEGLQQVLELSRKIDPSIKKYLPKALSKIGCYFRFACDLIDAARSPETTIFRSIRIQPMEGPRFDQPFITNRSMNFDQAAQRVTGSSYQHLLNAYGLVVSKARTNFEKRISNHAIPWKVHAEIQLLFHYKQQPQASRPRIISSSKSACYLCNLFIQLHGGLHVPRTHGTLYDRWVLPEGAFREIAVNAHLLSVIESLNAALEAKIKSILRTNPRSLPQPEESVVHLSQPWSPASTVSEIREQIAIQDAVNHTRESPSGDQRELPPNVFLASPSISSNLKSSVSFNQPMAQSQPLTPLPNLPPPSPTSLTHHISSNTPTTYALTPSQSTLIIEAGPLTLHLSWDLNVADGASPSRRSCWVRIQRIAFAQPKSSHEIIDVASLPNDHDVIVERGAALSSRELALQLGGDVVVVKYMFGDDKEEEEGRGWLGRE